jgi:hypothetical protein
MIFSESAQSGSCCVNCYHYYPLRREVLFNICFAAIQLTTYNENYEKTVYSVQVAEKQAYIFTRDGFYPDYADEQATQDPMELLYHISLTEHPAYAAAVCTDGIPFR